MGTKEEGRRRKKKEEKGRRRKKTKTKTKEEPEEQEQEDGEMGIFAIHQKIVKITAYALTMFG